MNTRPNFITFSVHVDCSCGSVLSGGFATMLCTSGFVDDVMGPMMQEMQ